MNFVKSLFIFAATILINDLTVAFENTETEYIDNVYVDTLVQRYMALESSLWNEIRYSETKNNELVLKILEEHSEFFTNESFDSIINAELKLKFTKYLMLSVADEQNNATDFSNITLKDFNRNVSLTVDLFDEIRKDVESLSCDNRSTKLMESSSHNMFLFYQLFVALMLASYASEQRKNMMEATLRNVDGYDYEALTAKFNDDYKRIRNLAMNQIKDANTDIWMCDLDYYTKEDESIQITNLLQGYVENEINMNNRNSCAGSCNDYKYARNQQCASGTYRKRRRYDSIKYASGRFMGREFCVRERQEVRSYLTLWMTFCSYCFCYCDADTEYSDRYFSLKAARSDVSKNKIITGIGLNKRNGIFSWSLTQSILRSNGRVDQLQNQTTKSYSSSNRSADELYEDFHHTQDGMEEGLDYHKLSWQNRSINLATVLVPHGSAITGIRFTVLKEHLNFEIQATPFDFNTGLLYGQSQWVGNKNEKRTVLLLDRPEPSHPLRINTSLCKRSVPDFTPNKFVKFRPTDPDKDVGQTTVPFIDTQMVRPSELTLLSGVSLYYKGRPGYGGFVAPKLIVYDMSKYLTS